jgi:chemotaxis protein MotB
LTIIGCKTPVPPKAGEPLLSENEQMKKRIGELQDLINNLEKTIDQKNEEVTLLKAKIESLEKSQQDLSESLSSAKGDLEKKIADLIAERDALSNDLAACNAEGNRLKESMAREAERLKEIFESLKKRLKDEIDKGNLEILQYEGVLIVNIHTNVLFEPDSPVLLKEYEPVLKILAESFIKVPEKIIRVEGHTASVIQSKYETSWQLGAERSLSVVRFFQEKCTIDPLRLVILSFGEYRPLASNATEAGRVKNRRVQIVLIDRPLYQVKELKQIK